MIHIKRDATKIPEEWIKKAQALTADLEKLATPAERSAFIKKKGAVWGEIKEILQQMSHDKCWYSEAMDTVSDWHVDHFRPKGRVTEEGGTKYEGYHWLAFDWENYRICGSVPNSPHKDEEGRVRGKGDRFPLAKGSPRASWGDRCVEDEIVLLLDPTKVNDPAYLTFDERGLPIPAVPDCEMVAKRVAITTHLLFLDSPRLKDARQKLWRNCADEIAELRQLLNLQAEKHDAERRRRVEVMARKIAGMAAPDQPYSSTARACIRTLAPFVFDIADALKDAA